MLVQVQPSAGELGQHCRSAPISMMGTPPSRGSDYSEVAEMGIEKRGPRTDDPLGVNDSSLLLRTYFIESILRSTH